MLEPQTPSDETERLRSLYRLGILDSDPEERFDRITRIAQRMFQVPIALISLVDRDRQWFKSCIGLEVQETPRRVSFCAHAVLTWSTFVVPDTYQDPRFADNPLVSGPPHIRFYAGQPLRAADGQLLGTLCIIDRRPRHLDSIQQQQLRDLAIWAERELHLTELCHHGLPAAFVGTLQRQDRLPTGDQPERPTVLALEVQHFDTLARHLGPVLEQRLLVTICRRLRHRLRTTDRLVTLDNGRFRILLSDSRSGGSDGIEPWPHSAGLVMRLQQVFAEPFSIDGQTLHLMVIITLVSCQNSPDCQSSH